MSPLSKKNSNKVMSEEKNPKIRLPYRGRFAPSPTGELHAGSLACAMASFLDARAHDGIWIVRIEDIDTLRCRAEYGFSILETLKQFGLVSDEEVVWQSKRTALYEAAFIRLKEKGIVYGCACSRADIEKEEKRLNLPHGRYPGTCRSGTHGKPIRSWRFKVATGVVMFKDRLCEAFAEDTEEFVGDFIIRRADGLWAYQLAVVVDDAAQGITDIVRGEDLLDNTPRQLQLIRALGYKAPRYMHIPLVLNSFGEKLSKQRKAPPIVADNPLATLEALLAHFHLEKTGATTLDEFWRLATLRWKEKYVET